MSDVRISFVRAGFCRHPGRVADPALPWTPLIFPATVAVIEHPRHGVILFDTGYSERFFHATQKFPERAYRWLTPVFLDEGQTARQQLGRLGIGVNDVTTIVLSHFHADHLAGAADFPRARYVYQREAFTAVETLARIPALRRAYLPALLPPDFAARAHPIDHFAPSADLPMFEGGHDLFGDGSLRVVPTPGHATGHVGLYVRTQSKDYLLVGDAGYVRGNITHNRPSSLITRFIFDDFKEYRRTLDRLHQFHRRSAGVEIVPCHCQTTLDHLPRFGEHRA